MDGITLLTGHVSPETAHLTPDYPSSFTLRCTRRESNTPWLKPGACRWHPASPMPEHWPGQDPQP
jgi:hypothetical protein